MTTPHRYRLKPVSALIATLAAGSTFAQDAAPAADTQALGAVTVRSPFTLEVREAPVQYTVERLNRRPRTTAGKIHKVRCRTDARMLGR